MTNPFNWYGPQFLVFYLVLSILLHILVRVYIKLQENGPVPKIEMNDPYQIAYLRGGSNEAIRIATISLIDRGLLKVNERLSTVTLETADKNDWQIVQRRLEKALLHFFAVPQKAFEAFKSSTCLAACDEYKQNLGRQKLVCDADVIKHRLPIILLAGALLASIAALKVYIALERGRHNIGLLIVLAIGSLIMLSPALKKHRTATGDLLVKDLKKLFEPLYLRRAFLKPGGQTNEAALLAAVFGVSALSISFISLKTIYPKSNSNSCGSSCGSSCSSSGCGGGSCGGGCGGCGS